MDDTLYPLSSGVNLACRKNIEGMLLKLVSHNITRTNLIRVLVTDYMLKYLHMDESEVPRMCLELYREYGTTMAGLKVRNYPVYRPGGLSKRSN